MNESPKEKSSDRVVRGAIGFVVLIASVCAVGCGAKKNEQPQGGAPPAAPVTVALAEQQSVPIQVHAIGTAQPYRTVQVKSQVNGQIEKVLFEQGDYVRQGQVLFQLDKRPFQAALDQALGTLAKDKANAADQRAQANRDEALLKAKVIAQQLAETQEAAAQSAAATVQADQAAVETARVNLSYTEIKAPIDGQAGAILVNIGNVAQANSTNALTIINQVTPIYVQFSVPEAQLAEIRKHKLGTLSVSASPPKQPITAQGKLTFINNTVDPSTGTIQLMATFDNRDRKLWPGAFLSVGLQLGVENAVVVPAGAIQTSQQGNYVYTVRQDDTAVMQPVQTSRTYQGLAVVEKGIQAGNKVVVNGQMRVIPNNKVKVTKTVPTEPVPEQSQDATQQAASGAGGSGSGEPE